MRALFWMCLWVEKKNSVLPFLFLQMICFRKRKWKGWREWECNVPLTVSRVYISFSTSLIILFRFNEAIKMYEFIIYMKYFLFFFWPQQPTTSNFEWARKKKQEKNLIQYFTLEHEFGKKILSQKVKRKWRKKNNENK